MNDTIAAISSAGGPIGIIRVSGEEAIDAVNAIFTAKNGKSLAEAQSQKLIYGSLKNKQGKIIDCCYAVIMRKPYTYTGETMAEIQCHGSSAVLSDTLDALFAQNVRQAEPGEFTQRAFLNGKLDLSEAEAVHDLITARTSEAAQNAAAQMMGAVGSPVHQMREDLVGMAAHFHAVVDYPDEDIDPILMQDTIDLLQQTAVQITQMEQSFERGRILKEGIPCAILGRPNAGKSTLLNTLLGRERAIVTDIPGTTRDSIEETIKIGQIMLRLTDTAGLRETNDPVEQIGINRAVEISGNSSLVMAVFDGSLPLDEEDKLVLKHSKDQKAIAVINKMDLPQQIDMNLLKEHYENIVQICAKKGTGVDELICKIKELVGIGDGSFDGAVITNARQAAALKKANERTDAALYAAKSGITPDAIVMDIEGAIAALGEITGETVTESVVSRIFSDFCVGK